MSPVTSFSMRRLGFPLSCILAMAKPEIKTLTGWTLTVWSNRSNMRLSYSGVSVSKPSGF